MCEALGKEECVILGKQRVLRLRISVQECEVSLLGMGKGVAGLSRGHLARVIWGRVNKDYVKSLYSRRKEILGSEVRDVI